MNLLGDRAEHGSLIGHGKIKGLRRRKPTIEGRDLDCECARETGNGINREAVILAMAPP